MKKRWSKIAGLTAAAAGGYLIWRRLQPKEKPSIISTVNGVAVLRTPEERFYNLPGYAFTPHYTDIEGLRLHCVDEGPTQGEIVLMLHGEPSWSYLYRKMIPLFAAAGYRALAPDLIGFGKSDKLADKEAYSYQRHVDWLWAWVQALDLHQITLVCQDWGALIGLRLVAEHPERFARVVVGNGALPTGDQEPKGAFKAWRTFSQRVPIFPVGTILQGATTTWLSGEVLAAYNAPFPSEAYKAAARVFPVLVPTTPDDPAAAANREAWAQLKQFHKPFLTAFSDGDPIMRGGEQVFQKLVPGAQGQAHTIIEGAGHFLQEDKGEQLAQVVIDFMQANPLQMA